MPDSPPMSLTSSSVLDISPGAAPAPDMIWIPGRTFRMGSDDHYREERPAHDVRVDGFWIDRYPVTNDRFTAFVQATGHITTAEMHPDPADYPNAKADMLYAGSLGFVKPPGIVDRRDHFNWWHYVRSADWRHPQGAGSSLRGRHRHPVVHVTFTDAERFAKWG